MNTEKQSEIPWKFIVPAGVLALLVVVLIIGKIIFGVTGGSSVFSQKAPLQAVFTVDILDDSETLPWVTTAELYLKVTSSVNNDVTILAPLNIGENSGGRKFSINTPFIHRGQQQEILMFELLDDDDLDDESVELISSLSRKAGYMLFKTGQAFTLSKTGFVLPSELGEFSETFVKNGSIQLLNTGSYYDSLGTAEYIVNKDDPPISLVYATKLTVKDGDNARLDVRIHYQSRPPPNLP